VVNKKLSFNHCCEKHPQQHTLKPRKQYFARVAKLSSSQEKPINVFSNTLFNASSLAFGNFWGEKQGQNNSNTPKGLKSKLEQTSLMLHSKSNEV